MERPRIEKLRIQNFGCIKDATFELAPICALIGPNDSGKSTVLRALQLLTDRQIRLLDSAPFAPVPLSVPSPFNMLFREGAGFEFWSGRHQWLVALGEMGSLRRELTEVPEGIPTVAQGSLLVRLDPDSLRRPSPVIGPQEEFSFDRDGHGLAGILDAIRDRGDRAFEDIRDGLLKLFPAVKYLQLKPVQLGSATQKVLQLELTDGTRVPANLISEGILYFLAFAVIERIERPAVLLIEEPENGLHPARIADIMAVLRRISEKTQVVIATHSPLVINEMQGHEVILLTRDAEKGTQARLLKDTYDYDARSRVFQNGELWLSYANGKDEQALLSKPQVER